MLVSEDQVQHWMKTVSRGKPERSLEVQPWDQPTNLLYDQAQAINKWLHWAIPRAFPKPVDWNKIQACTQKSDEPVYDSYNRFHIIFKANSGLSSDVDSTHVACNSMFSNRLTQNISLLVKRTRTEQENLSTPDSVNLINQLSHTLNESPKRKTDKILNLQLQQVKAPKWPPTHPEFLILLQKARTLEKNLLQI